MDTKRNKIDAIPKTPMGFFWYSTKPHITVAAVALSAVFFATLLGTGSPYVFKKIIDSATVAIQSGSSDFSTPLYWSVVYVCIISLMYVMWRTSGYVGMKWVTRSEKTSYTSLFNYLSLHSHTYFSDRFAGAVTNKISHASDGISDLIQSFLWNYFQTFISFIVSGILIFTASVQVGFIYVGLIIVLFVLNYFLVRYRRPYVVNYSEERTVLRGQAVDISSNISAVRQFARHRHEHRLIEDQADKRRSADLKQWRLSEHGLVINNIIIVIAIGAMFFSMVFLLRSSQLSLGDFVMVITLMFGITETLNFIGNTMNRFIGIYSEIEEGLTDILIKHEIKDNPDAEQLVAKHGEIMFQDVEFQFTGEPVFHKLNLHIPAGERIGIVGPSGAGKSTLVSILLRQHEINSGTISIDSQNIAQVAQDSLRQSISVVPQDPLLFHRSIMDNIRYGRLDATDEEVIEAATMAHADEFIQKAPEGYDTLVGERGIKLSGGQRQRIAIARAILKRAKILILDEATSSLDSESEVLIQQALHTLMEGKTVLAIAHRFSTLREMNRIVVFDNGKIIQDGSHNELIKDKKSTYARLWNHQAGIFL